MAPSIRSRGRRSIASVVASLTTASLLVACARRPPAPTTLRMGGSSTVYPIMVEAVEAYKARGGDSSTRIELSFSGTSDGLRRFCSGELPIVNASRPISSAELERCRTNAVTFIELPIAFDALTVVVNGGNDWARMITTSELSRLWRRDAQGRIGRWNQVNIDWPDRPIALCGPGRDSGTYDYFNKAINGDEEDSRSDYIASEDDNVIVSCVSGNPDALGYLGFAYYTGNTEKLKALSILDGPRQEQPVAPSIENVQNQKYIPLSRPLFVYVNDKQMRSQEAIRQFVAFTVGDGLSLVRKAGYIPLPSSTYQIVEAKLYKHILGTSFGGDLPVGLTIGEALRRSFDETRRPEYR